MSTPDIRSRVAQFCSIGMSAETIAAFVGRPLDEVAPIVGEYWTHRRQETMARLLDAKKPKRQPFAETSSGKYVAKLRAARVAEEKALETPPVTERPVCATMDSPKAEADGLIRSRILQAHINGMSAFAVSQSLGVPIGQAEDAIAEYQEERRQRMLARFAPPPPPEPEIDPHETIEAPTPIEERRHAQLKADVQSAVRPVVSPRPDLSRATSPKMMPQYLPTIAEIDAECEAIQAEWTRKERRMRLAVKPKRWTPPQSRCVDWSDF